RWRPGSRRGAGARARRAARARDARARPGRRSPAPQRRPGRRPRGRGRRSSPPARHADPARRDSGAGRRRPRAPSPPRRDRRRRAPRGDRGSRARARARGAGRPGPRGPALAAGRSCDGARSPRPPPPSASGAYWPRRSRTRSRARLPRGPPTGGGSSEAQAQDDVAAEATVERLLAGDQQRPEDLILDAELLLAALGEASGVGHQGPVVDALTHPELLLPRVGLAELADVERQARLAAEQLLRNHLGGLAGEGQASGVSELLAGLSERDQG